MVQGAPRTIVEQDKAVIVRLREVCFGCGCSRLVDSDPPWETVDLEAKEQAEPLGLCPECHPLVAAFMKKRNQSTIWLITHLDAALGSPSWLRQATDGAFETIVVAARRVKV
jgi:hypothetical protein